MPSTVRATQRSVATYLCTGAEASFIGSPLAFRRFAAALAKPAVAG
jgi:hypothetical protein